MTYRSLKEAFDADGEWYLPDNPERKVRGSLRYTPERTELQLHDTFSPLQGTIHLGNENQTYSVIYGVTREGEAMTLLNAQQIGTAFNSGSGGFRHSEKVISSWLLVGEHLPPDFTYPKMRFRIPGLQVWHARPVVEGFQDHDNETGSMTLSYIVRRTPEETTRVPAIEANLNWGIGYEQKSDPFTSVTAKVSGWVTIQPDTPKPIEWYIEQQSKITTMLAFIAGSPMPPDCILAQVDKPDTIVSVMVALRATKYCPYNSPSDFFMARDKMEADITTIVCRWFEVYPKVHLPSQLALSVLASEGLWLHVEFLSLMQALEGFHRALFEGDYLAKTDYEPIKKCLVEAIPSDVKPDHREALKSKIRYGYQFSLSKRLNALAELLSEPIRQVVIASNGKIPRLWIDTRNYYTHWDEEGRDKILDGQRLYDAIVHMRHFLQALYLDFMGIPQTAIINSLCNTSRIAQHLAQINLRERHRSNPKDTSGVIMSVTEQQANRSKITPLSVVNNEALIGSMKGKISINDDILSTGVQYAD